MGFVSKGYCRLSKIKRDSVKYLVQQKLAIFRVWYMSVLIHIGPMCLFLSFWLLRDLYYKRKSLKCFIYTSKLFLLRTCDGTLRLILL